MQQFLEFVTNHWMMWTSLVIVLMLIIKEETQGSQSGASVSPANAVNLINHQDAVVIDLRDKDTFKQGHIINAVNKSFEALIKQKDYQKKSLLLVGSNDQQCLKHLSQLKQEGFENVYSLQGGMKAWNEAELPTAT